MAEENKGMQELMKIAQTVNIGDMLPEEFKISEGDIDKIIGTADYVSGFASKYLTGESKSSIEGEEHTPKMVLIIPVKSKLVVFIVNREKYCEILFNEGNMTKAITESKVFSTELTDFLKSVMGGNLDIKL